LYGSFDTLERVFFVSKCSKNHEEKTKATFFLTFLKKKPSQAKTWFLMESEATQNLPKQLKASSLSSLAN